MEEVMVLLIERAVLTTYKYIEDAKDKKGKRYVKFACFIKSPTFKNEIGIKNEAIVFNVKIYGDDKDLDGLLERYNKAFEENAKLPEDKQKKTLLKFVTDVYLCFNIFNHTLIRWAAVLNFKYYPTLGVYVRGEVGVEKYREEKVARLEKKVKELEKTIGNVVITEKREKKAPTLISLKNKKMQKGNANLTTEVEDEEVDIAEEIGQEVLKQDSPIEETEETPTETLVETLETEEDEEIPVETPTTDYIDDLFKDLE